MRSWRRLSWTSICDQALSTWLRFLTRLLYPSQKNHDDHDQHDDDDDDDGDHGSHAIGRRPTLRHQTTAGSRHGRAGDRPLVRGQEPLGEVRPSRTRRPGGRPAATSSRPAAGSSSSARRAARSSVGVARRDQQRLATGPGRRAVAVDVGGHHGGAGGHRLEQHDPERLPVERGKHATVAPRRRARFSSSVTRPSHCTRGTFRGPQRSVRDRRRSPTAPRRARCPRTRRAAPRGPCGARGVRRRRSPARATA